MLKQRVAMSNAQCTEALAPVPYFSQWESRDLTGAVLSEGAQVALARDPRWASSGAGTLAEYVTWGAHVCGMACLKMILAARTGRIIPTLELARECTAYGGYTVDVDTGRIRGLIYAPFVRFVRERFGVDSEVITGTTAEGLPRLFDRAEFFLASVHPSIRWPHREPPATGGHLVLVIQCTSGTVVFHNPSGHDQASQEYARLDINTFYRFFAGRGIAILR